MDNQLPPVLIAGKPATAQQAQDILQLGAIGLPKWPQMLVWGAPVTADQAKDIILRTDGFLTDISGYMGGNNRQWNKWAQDTLGLNLEKYGVGESDHRLRWDTQSKLRDLLGYVDTEYVGNHWASNAFVYGPHGWCHPNGNIGFLDNVGKWPDANDIWLDWVKLVDAFPYLDLNVTLMDGESCQEDTKPVFSLRIAEGKVQTLPPYMPPEGVVVKRGEEDIAGFAANLMNPRREQGLPDYWIEMYAERVRPLVPQALDWARAEQADAVPKGEDAA